MTLLLKMAREAVLAKVAQRVSQLARSYVEGWARGDFSLVERVALRHENEIRAWKEVVLQTIDDLTVEELLEACKSARPDFTDLWEGKQAHDRLQEEWARAREYVAGL